MYRKIGSVIIVVILILFGLPFLLMKDDNSEQNVNDIGEDVRIAHAEEKLLTIEKSPRNIAKVTPTKTYTEVTKANSEQDSNHNVKSTEEVMLEELKGVAATFFNELIQPTDNEYRVFDYGNKQMLIQHLTNFASKQIASYYVDGIYEEKDGYLYIIPMDAPPWINEKQPISLHRKGSGYSLNQMNNSDLYGSYKVEVTFEYSRNNWIITSVNVEQS